MKQNNIDRLIKDTYTEFNSEMDIYSNIEVPDFDMIMNKFHANVKEKSNRPYITKKIALVASFTLVILLSTFISTIPKVAAFKFNIIKKFEELRGNTKDIKFSSNNSLDNNVVNSNGSADQIEKILSIDEVQKEVPFKLLVPEYLPHGYTLQTVKLLKSMDDYFSVNQTYTNSTGKIIQIYQSTISKSEEATISISSDLTTEDIMINNIKVNFATDNENFKMMIWVDSDIRYKLLIPYNVSNDEMKKIIGLIK